MLKSLPCLKGMEDRTLIDLIRPTVTVDWRPLAGSLTEAKGRTCIVLVTSGFLLFRRNANA
jgi:hypothetical protein